MTWPRLANRCTLNATVAAVLRSSSLQNRGKDEGPPEARALASESGASVPRSDATDGFSRRTRPQTDRADVWSLATRSSQKQSITVRRRANRSRPVTASRAGTLPEAPSKDACPAGRPVMETMSPGAIRTLQLLGGSAVSPIDGEPEQRRPHRPSLKGPAR